MQDGFVKVAARTPEVRVADVDFNTKAILEEVRRAHEDDDAKLVVLPELCVTAYTCEDLFWQETLLDAAERAIGTCFFLCLFFRLSPAFFAHFP